MITSNDLPKIRITRKDKNFAFKEAIHVFEKTNNDRINVAMSKSMRMFSLDRFVIPENYACWIASPPGFPFESDDKAKFQAYIAESGLEALAAILDSLAMTTKGASRVAADIRKGLDLYRHPKPSKAVELEI